MWSYLAAHWYSLAVAVALAVSAAGPGLLVLAGQLVIAVIVTGGYWLNRKKVEQIHVIVNQRHSDLEERVDQLIAALVEGGVKLPPLKQGSTAGRR